MKKLKLLLAAAFLTLWVQPATAQDSGLDHSKMDHGKMDHGQMDHGTMDHSQMDHSDHDHTGMEKPDLTNETIAENAVVITAKVNGLVCDFCAQALKKVFKKEAAVESLNVDLSAGDVHIALKPGHSITDERVADLIRKSGYSLVSTHRVSNQ